MNEPWNRFVLPPLPPSIFDEDLGSPAIQPVSNGGILGNFGQYAETPPDGSATRNGRVSRTSSIGVAALDPNVALLVASADARPRCSEISRNLAASLFIAGALD